MADTVAGQGTGWDCLQEAYRLLRNVAETKPSSDAPESFGQDLYILCAETAFQVQIVLLGLFSHVCIALCVHGVNASLII